VRDVCQIWLGLYHADISDKILLFELGGVAIDQFMLYKCLILIIMWPPLPCAATPSGQHVAAFVLLGSVGCSGADFPALTWCCYALFKELLLAFGPG